MSLSLLLRLIARTLDATMALTMEILKIISPKCCQQFTHLPKVTKVVFVDSTFKVLTSRYSQTKLASILTRIISFKQERLTLIM